MTAGPEVESQKPMKPSHATRLTVNEPRMLVGDWR